MKIVKWEAPGATGNRQKGPITDWVPTVAGSV